MHLLHFLRKLGYCYVGLCSWDSVSVDLGTLGSWTAEVGFVVTDSNGDTVLTHALGTT